MQKIIQFFLEEITDEKTPDSPSGATVSEPNLVLVCDSKTGSCTLTLMAATKPLRTPGASKVFLAKSLTVFDEGLPKGCLMSSSLSGVLAIDEREVIFPVLLDVGEGHLNVIALNVNDRIEDPPRGFP